MNHKAEKLDVFRGSFPFTPKSICSLLQGFMLISLISAALSANALADTTPPTISIDPFPYNISTHNQPEFTGTARDESSIITSIECRVNGGAWSPASPFDGSFDSVTERFRWLPKRPLPFAFPLNRFEARCWDSAGNVTSPPASYDFHVVGEEPVFMIKSRGNYIANGDSISKNPGFRIDIVSTDPPISARRSIKEASQPDEDIDNLTVNSDPDNPYIFYCTYSPTLNDGTYRIKIEVQDSEGDSDVLEANQLIVRANEEILVTQTPLNYPNPFNPDIPPYYTSISYALSRPADTIIIFFDINLNQVTKKLFYANQNGGNAGYNEIIWNGSDAAGSKVGNGIYIYLIQAEGKLVGKGKITVLRR